MCDRILDKFSDIHVVDGKQTTERLLYEQNRLYRITVNNMQKIKNIIGGCSNVELITILSYQRPTIISVCYKPSNHQICSDGWTEKEAY